MTLEAAKGAHPKSMGGMLISTPPNDRLTCCQGYHNLTVLEVYPIFGVPTEAVDANFKGLTLNCR